MPSHPRIAFGDGTAPSVLKNSRALIDASGRPGSNSSFLDAAILTVARILTTAGPGAADFASLHHVKHCALLSWLRSAVQRLRDFSAKMHVLKMLPVWQTQLLVAVPEVACLSVVAGRNKPGGSVQNLQTCRRVTARAW